MRLKKNDNVLVEAGTKVYCQEEYAQKLYDLYQENESIMPTFTKDLKDGDLLMITGVSAIRGAEVDFEVNNANTISVDLNKEKKFIDIFDLTLEEFVFWISGDPEDFVGRENYVSVTVDTHGPRGSLVKGHAEKLKHEFFEQITTPTTAYSAKIISKNKGGFLVDIIGVEAFLPGSLAAANKIADFDEYIGKKVDVMIEDYLKDIGTFIVSNKRYIKHMLPIRIAALDLTKMHLGIITDTAKFGIFAEIEDFFTGLLHSSKMDPETLENFKQREYRSGDTIEVWIKEVTENNRLVFTSYSPEKQEEIEKEIQEKEELERKDRDSKAFKIGSSYSGLITSIKPFGAFARIWNGGRSVTGLIIKKDLDNFDLLNEGDKPKLLISDADGEKYFFTVVEETD